MSEWISVEDRLPEDENKWLVLTNGDVTIFGLYNTDNQWADFTNASMSGDPIYREDITHWKPLPGPPVE